MGRTGRTMKRAEKDGIAASPPQPKKKAKGKAAAGETGPGQAKGQDTSKANIATFFMTRAAAKQAAA